MSSHYEYWNPELDIRRDVLRLAFWIVTIGITTVVVQNGILWPLARYSLKSSSTPKKKMTMKEKRKTMSAAHMERDRALYAKQVKFVVSGTKMVSYISMMLLAIWALQDQTEWFWNPALQHIPFAKIPGKLALLYFVETAHYMYTLIAMYYEPKMKDRLQMTIHHIFTITLLVTSYVCNTMKYGTSIMLLHDFSDPLMEIAKLFNYADIEWGANVFFVMFAASFYYLRDYVFPRYIISATYNYARPAGYPFYWITFVSLVGLWVLHLIWSYMIWQVFYNSVVAGKAAGDVREDYEELDEGK